MLLQKRANYISIDACGNGAEHTINLAGHGMNRRFAIASMLAGASAAIVPCVVRAKSNFSDRPIRVIVPVSPGGGVDTFARLIAAKIGEQRKVEFVVENRTGGNGIIAALDVQRAAPDGYVVLFHASTQNVARLVMRDVPYDPLTDFTPIALAGEAPLIHIIANNRPEKTVREMLPPPRPSRTTGRSRPRNSVRPVTSLRSRSISTQNSMCRSWPIVARRPPRAMSPVVMCR